jgi:hypothetical protein
MELLGGVMTAPRAMVRAMKTRLAQWAEPVKGAESAVLQPRVDHCGTERGSHILGCCTRVHAVR